MVQSSSQLAQIFWIKNQDVIKIMFKLRFVVNLVFFFTKITYKLMGRY